MTPVIHRFTTKLFLVLVLLGIVIVPSVSADPTGGFIWQGTQNIFFQNTSSTTVPGYYVMDHIPKLADETSITKTVLKNQQVTIGKWITPIGSPYNNTAYTIAPGIWAFHMYAKSTSPSGTDQLSMYLLNRSASGVETNIWPNKALSEDVSQAGGEYLWEYVRRNFTYMNAGDRLVIMINATTTGSTTDFTIYLDGNSRVSRVQSSEWIGPTNVWPIIIPASGEAGNSITYALIGGGIGGFVAIMYWRRRFKK